MVVGFDFGTHQTKVCIADYSDPQRPIHTFWKFATPEGESFTLPSIVQVNKDDTLSYGYVDETKAKYMPLQNYPMPQKPSVEEPKFSFTEKEPQLKLPPKPTLDKLDWKEQLLALTSGVMPKDNEWLKACEEARLDYDQDYRLWKIRYNKAKQIYDEQMEQYRKVMDCYEDDLAKWSKNQKSPEPAIFKYFKIASFSNYQWDYLIDKDILCIWYIAYILFDLESKYGQTFSIQMGYPTDAHRLINRRNHAVRLILSAYHLVEDVFKGDKDAFLLTPYPELLTQTEIIPPTNEKKEEYGILALPEAYANLVTATTQHKISRGISFVVDIGGGTTDISLFEVDEKGEPHIYGYSSMDVGINYLMEQVVGEKSMLKGSSLDILTDTNRHIAANLFYEHLDKEVNIIVSAIYTAFKKVNLPVHSLTEALNNRIIVYSGGGSTYGDLCSKIRSFTDVIKMDSSIWNGFVIEEEKQVKPLACILSTALGLSVPREHDEIVVSDTEAIFDHLPQKGEEVPLIWGRKQEELYGMLDD